MKRKCTLIILIAVTLIGTVYLFRVPVLTGMGEYLVSTTPLERADLIVALGGSKGRKRGAVALLREGFASKVMFTGFDIDIRDYQCQGISEKEIVLPPMAAYTTYEEALVVLNAAEENNFHAVIIVTSPYHLRRASFIFHKIFNGKDIKLMFYACQNKAFQMDRWWKSYIGRKMVIMEYLGLVYYWVRY
ncbi:hypothetical protein BMS3Abin07_01574 [bacterium BMS3Abin07]|nr:hypothetical protein BMS3Abin07_01574 [bacterium BMS3Abin07]GBE32110.1 hypothetical protein BMS3Bbin05_01019 [bacterium BMS3Bbin05]HDO22921.1 YdcF family protein [Nitrospirota bacterium]